MADWAYLVFGLIIILCLFGIWSEVPAGEGGQVDYHCPLCGSKCYKEAKSENWYVWKCTNPKCSSNRKQGE